MAGHDNDVDSEGNREMMAGGEEGNVGAVLSSPDILENRNHEEDKSTHPDPHQQTDLADKSTLNSELNIYLSIYVKPGLMTLIMTGKC